MRVSCCCKYLTLRDCSGELAAQEGDLTSSLLCGIYVIACVEKERRETRPGRGGVDGTLTKRGGELNTGVNVRSTL